MTVAVTRHAPTGDFTAGFRPAHVFSTAMPGMSHSAGLLEKEG